MPKTSDLLAAGFCRADGLDIAVSFVDATETARALCRDHLCGPAASRALGEALAATALIATDLQAGGTLMLRVSANGPLQGLCVEAAAQEDGAITLRGFTLRKTMDALDDSEDPRMCDILGDTIGAQVAHTNADGGIHHTSFEARGADLSALATRYFCDAVRLPALAHAAASLYGGYLNYARGFVAIPRPGTRPEDIESLRVKFEDGSVAENLDACLSLADLCAALELPPPERVPARPVSFRCGCSRERVAGMLKRLSAAELRAILARGADPNITCHFCGRTHAIPLAAVEEILDDFPF